MSDSNKAVLEAANAAVTHGDNEGYLAYCTDDTHWVFVGEQSLRGKEAVRQWMAEAYRYAPPQLTVDDLIAEGDFVVAVGDVSMTSSDCNSTHHAYCDVWRLRDSKLAELRAFVVEKEV